MFEVTRQAPRKLQRSMKMLDRLVPRTCRPARPCTDELRTSEAPYEHSRQGRCPYDHSSGGPPPAMVTCLKTDWFPHSRTVINNSEFPRIKKAHRLTSGRFREPPLGLKLLQEMTGAPGTADTPQRYGQPDGRGSLASPGPVRRRIQ